MGAQYSFVKRQRVAAREVIEQVGPFRFGEGARLKAKQGYIWINEQLFQCAPLCATRTAFQYWVRVSVRSHRIHCFAPNITPSKEKTAEG
jgi:hypothetical protein